MISEVNTDLVCLPSSITASLKFSHQSPFSIFLIFPSCLTNSHLVITIIVETLEARATHGSLRLSSRTQYKNKLHIWASFSNWNAWRVMSCSSSQERVGVADDVTEWVGAAHASSTFSDGGSTSNFQCVKKGTCCTNLLCNCFNFLPATAHVFQTKTLAFVLDCIRQIFSIPHLFPLAPG